MLGSDSSYDVTRLHVAIVVCNIVHWVLAHAPSGETTHVSEYLSGRDLCVGVWICEIVVCAVLRQRVI